MRFIPSLLSERALGLTVFIHATNTTSSPRKVTIEFSSTTLTPTRMYFAAHTRQEGIWVPWDQVEKRPATASPSGACSSSFSQAASSSGSSVVGVAHSAPSSLPPCTERPVAYIYRHGHGHGPRPGIVPRIFGLGNDRCDGLGLTWRPHPLVIPPDYEQKESWQWLRFRGAWGRGSHGPHLRGGVPAMSAQQWFYREEATSITPLRRILVPLSLGAGPMARAGGVLRFAARWRRRGTGVHAGAARSAENAGSVPVAEREAEGGRVQAKAIEGG